MHLKLILLVYCLKCIPTTSSHDHHEHILKEMKADGIVPQILDDAPANHLVIIYPNNKTVNLGNELTPTEVDDEPEVKWKADPKKYYTLIMFDPDAPSREKPTAADVKHWLVMNILGDDVKATGDVVAEYYGSGPPKGTGLHRYIFLIFEQKGRVDLDEPRSLTLSRAHRLNWSVKKLVEKYELGKPVAGDYFKAKWDTFVDQRNKYISNN